MADNDKVKNKGIGRRQFLKAAATTPVVGAFALSVYEKEKLDKVSREEILQLLQEDINPVYRELLRLYFKNLDKE